ncbi:PREDICTED: bidirectional sugar transporter SWEET2a-like [Nicotiana attenuata]|uniref:bidirectional sugar transporter SWEET2a-like n=1 Tax=Nicotiana attenuata TaxID=49451 RepID=UPI0009056039|nr:PREDICTED: bidirectional sugar transporter SWEET2a-like [Nicotiana attenuata]
MSISAANGLFSTYSICSNAAGIAGNLFAFVLFVSPIPTFRRIIGSKSTEQFSGLPYIYALLNCLSLICLWYGTPIVSPGIILVFTVNSVGAVFQLVYITIFFIFAEREKKVPNGIGGVLGVIQLVLYWRYSISNEEPTRPLLESYA